MTTQASVYAHIVMGTGWGARPLMYVHCTNFIYQSLASIPIYASHHRIILLEQADGSTTELPSTPGQPCPLEFFCGILPFPAPAIQPHLLLFKSCVIDHGRANGANDAPVEQSALLVDRLSNVHSLGEYARLHIEEAYRQLPKTHQDARPAGSCGTGTTSETMMVACSASRRIMSGKRSDTESAQRAGATVVRVQLMSQHAALRVFLGPLFIALLLVPLSIRLNFVTRPQCSSIPHGALSTI